MTKENVYDEQINPLMKRIIAICKERRIAFIADFSLDDDGLHCTSAILEDDTSPSDAQLKAWKLLKPLHPFALAVTEETKPNGDKKITINRIS